MSVSQVARRIAGYIVAPPLAIVGWLLFLAAHHDHRLDHERDVDGGHG